MDADRLPRDAESAKLLTAAEVASLLSVPVTWVRRRRDLPRVLLGRYVRFAEPQVREWLASHRERGRA